jgi:hypothetical protein
MEFITVATFDQPFEPQFALAKKALEDAGIEYFVPNKGLKWRNPFPGGGRVRLQVVKEKKQEAIEILEVLQKEA